MTTTGRAGTLKTEIIVYACILALSGLQVVLAYHHGPGLQLMLRMLSVAVIQAGLGATYFMHLRDERSAKSAPCPMRGRLRGQRGRAGDAPSFACSGARSRRLRRGQAVQAGREVSRAGAPPASKARPASGQIAPEADLFPREASVLRGRRAGEGENGACPNSCAARAIPQDGRTRPVASDTTSIAYRP